MPYVVGYDTVLHRPAKRRRLSTQIGMARRKSMEEQVAHDVSGVTQPVIEQVIPAALSHSHDPAMDTPEIRTSSREELIECIKRGEKPLWIPSANLQALHDEETSSRPQNKAQLHDKPTSKGSSKIIDDPFFGTWTETKDGQSNNRSALHRGDFGGYDEPPLCTEEADADVPSTLSQISPSKSSPPPWLRTAASSPIGQAISELTTDQGLAITSARRRRAPSLGSSLSSSFVLRTPTSPLVHAVNNANLDNPLRSTPTLGGYSTDKTSRRRTMPPNAFHSLGVWSADATPPNFSRPFTNPKQDLPVQHVLHQPRRSLSSFTYQPSPSPQDRYVRARRSSLATDSSHRRRTSMVGSFEESILRGRMSSPASQPFDFVAQIGVMGKGDCPASLKCPAHVTVPFQAVFYHYPSLSSHSLSPLAEAPSPYVGTIDLENNLKPVLLITKRKNLDAFDMSQPSVIEDPRAPENTPIGKALARDAEKQKQKQISLSPKISLGGVYRVPQKGQVQIIIKNQNKTAVKLFLIPYDLSDMEAGTKTFVRQRSYSCGPILEGSLDSTAGSVSMRDPLRDKQILRYLVHVRFCCPTKGKYYLNDHIKVVFANRVPDGKEKLKNEIQIPEPRYSSYRPSSRRHQPTHQSSEDHLKNSPSTSISHLDLVQEDQSLVSTPKSCHVLPDSNILTSDRLLLLPQTENSVRLPLNIAPRHSRPRTPTTSSHVNKDAEPDYVSPLFQKSNSSSNTSPNIPRALSPVPGFLPSTSTRSSPIPWDSPSTSSTTRSFSPPGLEVGNGLLSQQFRTFYSNARDSRPSDNNDTPSNVSIALTKNKIVPKDPQGVLKASPATIDDHAEQM